MNYIICYNAFDMDYKTQLHIHTYESSSCSKISAKDIVEKYFVLGYKTIVITDHVNNSNIIKIAQREGIKANSNHDLFCGYYQALEYAKNKNMNVLYGMEIRLDYDFNEFLIYGGTPDLFKNVNLGLLLKYDTKSLKNFCTKNNLIMIQAHPFRESGGKQNKPVENCFVDGYEIYNSSPYYLNSTHNNLATRLKTNDNICTCGDDTHSLKEIGKTAIITNFQIKTEKDLFIALKSNKFERSLI